MTNQNAVDEVAVVEALKASAYAVSRAMVILLSFQTEGERVTKATTESNGKGFNYHDAEYGTYCALYVLGLRVNAPDADIRFQLNRFFSGATNGRLLTGKHLDRCRKMTIKYRKQILAYAKAQVEEDQIPDTVKDPNPLKHFEDCPETLRSRVA